MKYIIEYNTKYRRCFIGIKHIIIIWFLKTFRPTYWKENEITIIARLTYPHRTIKRLMKGQYVKGRKE